MKTLRIFISSPSDVRPERVRAYDVITRLQTRYRAFLKLEPILWEDEAMRATASFQNQIVPPSSTDIVICILWAKIGTRLPQDYKRPDGTIPTGTEWEFEDAYRSFQVKGSPDLLVYRKTTPPTVTVTSDDFLRDWMQQKKRLDAFIDHWSRDHEGAFKAAFNSFKTDEEFEQKLEKHLEKVINDKLKTDGQTRKDGQATAGITWFEPPYLGLKTFQPEHAPIFFGRDLAINEITQRLLAQAANGRVFLMILGMSGCGKSSLARAGLLAELGRPAVIDKVGCWRWAILRAAEVKGTLIEGLAAVLLGPKPALPELAALGFDAPKLAKLLGDAPTHALPLLEVALGAAARQSAKEHLSTEVKPARFVLLVDQLEEIFTLPRFTAEQRAAFATALSVLSRSGLVWVITTMRTDLYARCAEVAELVALKGNDGQYDLSPPTLSELGQMIRAPAAAAGLNFEFHPATRQPLDDALYEEAGKNPEVLPLLEFCLDELYKLRTPEPANLITWAAYRELGGLKGAITKRAEEVYTRLSPAARDALPAVLGALIAIGKTATARPAGRKSLASHPGGEEVVAAYVEASLFVTDTNQTGEVIVTLAHEALISGWTRVQTWLHDNEDFLRVKARIAHAAQLWAEANRDRDFLLVEGKPLAEAEDALKRRRGELEPEEIEFVEISSRAAARSRRLRRYQAAAVLTIGLSLIFGSVLLRQLQQKRDAQAAAAAARLATSASDSALATQELQKNNVRAALAYLADALRNNPGNTQATALAISILRSCPLPIHSFRHQDEVHDVQFSPDGTRVVTASADGTAQLWQTSDGAKVGGPLQHAAQAWVHTAGFSPDSNWVVTASWDGTARIWDARTGAARTRPGTTEPIVLQHASKKRVTSASFSPRGQWVVTTSADGLARLWDARTGEPVLDPQSHQPVELRHGGTVWAAAFSPTDPDPLNKSDSHYLVTASEDKTALLYDILNGGKARVLQHDGGVNGANFSPDGKWIVTGSDNGFARLWSVGSNATPVPPLKHDLPVVQPSFSPDGRWIVTSSNDNTAQIWDARTGDRHGEAMVHEGWVRIARFSPDGRLVATGSADGTARIWDAMTGKPVSSPMYHGSAVYALNFSPDGRFLATASFDHIARLWLVQSARVDKPMTHGKAITAAVFSPDRKFVVTASDDGTAQVWDTDTGIPTGAALAHEKAVTSISLSADGSRLATGSADDTVRVWDPQSHRQIGASMRHELVSIVRFSPDGKSLVTASPDGTVRLWETATGQAQGVLTKHSDVITAIAFSPDSRWVLTASKDTKARVIDLHNPDPKTNIARELSHNNGVESIMFGRFAHGDRLLTASDDHSAQVWDAQTGARIGLPMQHDGWIYDAEFSPDGKRVVTASADGTARVWDAFTGLPLTDPMRHRNAVKSASFSRDGIRIATASWDRSARMWDTQTGQPVSVPLLHADRLTSASFSLGPERELMLTSSLDGTARLWIPVPIIKSAPDWLLMLMENVGGLRLDEARNLVLTNQGDAELKDRISRLPEVDDLSTFAHWLIADPATRHISPLSKISVTEFVRTRLEERTGESLKMAYEADPGNALVLARLAESVAPTDPITAELYCRLALQRARATHDSLLAIPVETIVRGLFPNLKEPNAPAGSP